jgi:putative membrane protein
MTEKTWARGLLPFLIVTGSGVLIWSAVAPKDYFTWALEVAPAVAGFLLLVWLYPRFRFTPLVYVLIWAHAIVLMVGGHYTYAEVPLFNWFRDTLHLARNHYDRVGHFMQGLGPAMIAREVLLRKTPLRRGRWLAFLVLCVCMAISATYEIVEWAVAALTGSAADAFLGGQGDVWDSQKDMVFCFLGAAAALILLSKLHDRQLKHFRSAWK